ncbi:putative transcription factor [Phaeomoniella chlamydospora]|uniref:DNA-binding protein RAP1 n=1 Tax=Phaeomoniella chlamydospora TaxID=158046 RepID=A0A0G2EEP5_PHACM|nr:putative transcription factor [Phaeomoniella chlamydospora]
MAKDSGAQTQAHPLFNGLKFWLSHQVPQRSQFISEIKENGGHVVDLEKNADIKIVDHVRKQLPPGACSYRFLEESVQNHQLAEIENHLVHPQGRQARPVGSISTASKGSRTPFTASDDQFLYDWVKPIEDAGGSVSGNKIYQDIEAANPRHTFQSWRDRWLKHEVSVVIPARTVSSPVAQSTNATVSSELSEDAPAESTTPFTEEDALLLMNAAKHIANLDPEKAPGAWRKFATSTDFSHHTDQEWQQFWEMVVRPHAAKSSQSKKIKPSTAQEELQSFTHPPISRNTVTDNSPTNLVVQARKEVPASPERDMQASEDEIESQKEINQLEAAPQPASHVDTGSSLFFSDDEYETPRPDRRTQREQSVQTSPMHINLLFGEKIVSSIAGSVSETSSQSQQSASEALGKEQSSTDENFETAQAEQANESEHFETAPQGRIETQAIFAETQPELDLDLPEPEGGWEAFEEDEAEEETSQTPTTKPIDQYNILQSTIPETLLVQEESVNFPSSPPSSSIPPIPSSQRTTTAFPPSHAIGSPSAFPPVYDIDTYIDTRLSHYTTPNSPSSISNDLESLLLQSAKRTLTSLSALIPQSFILADIVFNNLKSGKHPPDNIRGIWTEDDDRDLLAGDARAVDRVRKKHGDEGIEGRWEVLDLLR